jgi:hypothetical protein
VAAIIFPTLEESQFIVPTLRRGNVFRNAPALPSVTLKRLHCIPAPERGNDVTEYYD